MRRAQQRGWVKSAHAQYLEDHHIFPESIFGKNSITVRLTAREHYVAHMLLWKALLKRYGNKDQRTIKMAYAAWRMCFPQGDQENCRVSSKLYEALRTEISHRVSERTRALMADLEYKKLIIKRLKEYYANNKHSQLGKPRTEEEKRKISESTRGEKHHMWGKVGHRKGMKNSPSHREGISETRCKKFGNIWKITDPEGRIHIAKSLKKFCKEHNLGAGHMYNVANGKLKQHKGWTVKNMKDLIV
jgi:hypothetical protein